MVIASSAASTTRCRRLRSLPRAPSARAGSPARAASSASAGERRRPGRSPCSTSSLGRGVGQLQGDPAARRAAPRRPSTCSRTTLASWSRSSDLNCTISSIRFKNSGRKMASRLACVRGHDHDRIAEVDRAALAVGQPAVVEQLQQDVEHVGVGLLDLVQQHHRVRAAAHRLGQLAALVVADVAGRRAHQPRDASASPCTPTCRSAPSPSRCRTGTPPAPWPARSCRRRWGRGR